MEITETDYLKLCESYPVFKQVGFDNFGPKIWLIFRALKFSGTSQVLVSSNPCPSLMEHKITFDQIGFFLEELKEKNIFSSDGSGTYHVIPKVGYELHNVCYEMSKKIKKSRVNLKQILIECGYPNTGEINNNVKRVTSSDDTENSEALKDLLSQIAFAGARFLITGLTKLGDKIE